MPPQKKTQLIIEHIVERFLNPKMGYTAESFEAISQILDLPIYALKSMTPDESKIYTEVLGVQNIKDMAKLDYNHPLNRLIPPQTSKDIDEHLTKVEEVLTAAKQRIGDIEKLRNTILIANMISQAWQKRSSYLEKQETKVITLGLDNAGKTAILSALGGKLGMDSLAQLKPTKRIERKKIDAGNLSILLWDFGGQKDYRDLYLQEPEKYFIRTDLIMYVVDMQDPDRYEMSFDYFKQILEIMVRLSESPYILCFLHKADPDLLNDPEFQLHLDYVKDKIKNVMEGYPFDYDVYATSIYNFFSSEPKFSKFIKDVMKDHKSLIDPTMEKIQGLGQILDTTLNAVIGLSSSVNDQISSFGYRMDALERGMTEIRNHLAALGNYLQANAQKTSGKPSVPANVPPLVNLTPPVASSQIAQSPYAGTDNIKQIEQRAMTSRQTLSQTMADTSKDLQSSANKTRNTILQELQTLFQKAKEIK
jgi:hypothetical protein